MLNEQIESFNQQQMNDYYQFFETFGKATLLILSILVINAVLPVIWSFIIRPKFTHNRQSKAKYSNNNNNDPWAIITGCTDGLGLEFARNLAKKGFNLCLISRSQSKLDSLKRELATKYNQSGQVETIAFDFSSTNYQVIEKVIKSLPSIDLLINNVGVIPCSRDPLVDFFCETSKDIILKGLNINLISCLKMTNIVLPIMESQGSGTVVQLSSILGTKPSPLTSVYGGTKTFIDFFGRSLAMEYAEKNIRVVSLFPSFVRTKLTKMETNMMIPSADEFVESAISTVYHESRTTGFWSHQLLYRVGLTLSVLSPQDRWEEYCGLKVTADEMDAAKKLDNIPFEPHPFSDDIVSSFMKNFGFVKRSTNMD
ncbi:very-long-chain 3-oxoacyl-CoA reductase-like [Brevipalpus obovatus]|uniref:very-long-chain 3-oxoacyl-CoA reductase-like n=1 Tax=Brevipalpus obovatus TaxID=246614 RepID=UPI003D9E144F